MRPPVPGGTMSIAIARLRIPALGKYTGAALLAHFLAAGAHAQSGSPEWKSLGVKWTPDYSWGHEYGMGAGRMAADARGNLFVSQDDSLYVGTAMGTEWTKKPIVVDSGVWNHLIPVVLGPQGTMVWGSRTSSDWGATWKRDSNGYYSATAISADGYCLFGGSSDYIYRAAKLGDKPTVVHHGNSYSSIADFAFSGSGTAYAASQFGGLFMSRDDGKTWKDLYAQLKSDPYAPKNTWPFTGILALEPAYPVENIWMAGGRLTTGNDVEEYVWNGDSLATLRHANLRAPDSLFTCFRVQRLASGATALWLGTWGQGVYHSVDRGESWHAMNGGLTDLHIESMVLGSEGRIFALTKEGLFSLSGTTLGISPHAASRKDGNGRSLRLFGSAPAFGIDGSRAFGADGRILPTIPLPDAKAAATGLR
ncbi:MAG: BNR/Asp-box repeat protein [Fibrobacteres bacterium]|nr:BNR/Asp-box repeat protein [Fibrobacterota bacterium]